MLNNLVELISLGPRAVCVPASLEPEVLIRYLDHFFLRTPFAFSMLYYNSLISSFLKACGKG